MKQVFLNTTTADIDAKLKRDILDQQEKLEKATIIGLIILVFIFRGSIFYWLKFGHPIASPKRPEMINTQKEYIMNNYTPEEQTQKTFKYKSLISPKITTTIKPLADYEISGTVIGYRYNPLFFFKNNEKIQIYDLGLAFGDISDTDTLREIRISIYDNGAFSWNSQEPLQVDNTYVTSHITNLQIIPANNNIMAALLKLKEYNKVNLIGEVVSLDGTRPIKLYVKSIQIGSKLYE